MAESDLLERLRTELPRLLREHPEVRHEVWGLMLEAFPSREEFARLLEEVRALREDFRRHADETAARFEAMDRRFEELRADMNQRFEAVDRRFETVDRRFEAVLEELRSHREQLQIHGRQLRELTLHVSALGGRVGRGLEHIVREMVEEFAGQAFPAAERLVLRDDAGEVFGVPGTEIEFDLYAHNGAAYLVEVKSHLKPNDVLTFQRKAAFAERQLGRSVTRLIIALSMEPQAEALMQRLGIRYRVRARLEPD